MGCFVSAWRWMLMEVVCEPPVSAQPRELGALWSDSIQPLFQWRNCYAWQITQAEWRFKGMLCIKPFSVRAFTRYESTDTAELPLLRVL